MAANNLNYEIDQILVVLWKYLHRIKMINCRVILEETLQSQIKSRLSLTEHIKILISNINLLSLIN